MGEIIRLRPRQEARPDTKVVVDAAADRTDSATILLFMGVRYERHGEGKAVPTGRGKRKRA